MADVSRFRLLALLPLLAAGVLVSGWAAAQDGSICALLADDSKRLDCYDLLFRTPGTKPKSSEQGKTKPPSGIGKWRQEQQVSKLNDSTNEFVLVASLEPFSDGYHERYAGLTIACREGRTNLWIDFQTSMEGGAIIYRIDKLPADKLAVEHSSNYEALGLWKPEVAIAFVKKLLDADLLLVRAIPVRHSATDIEFPVTGLAEAIKPLRKACKW